MSMATKKNDVSVIIPAYNSEDIVVDTLEALDAQKFSGNYEIIIVDDGSVDNTFDVIKNFIKGKKKFRLMRQKNQGPAAARDNGAKKAKGNILLFTDSDCVPDKDWIRLMVAPFKDKEIVGVCGTYKTLNKESLIAKFAGFEIDDRHERLQDQKFIDFIGTFSAGYRKDIFKKFGGFDTFFRTSSGEDPDLSFKIDEAGLKMVFQPKAFVYHRHPDSITRFLKNKFRNGYWRVFVYKRHKSKVLKHSYTPKTLFMEMGALALTAALFVGNLLNLVPIQFPIITLAISLLLTLPLSYKIFKKDRIVGLISPFIIILRDLSTGLGVFKGMMDSLKRKL